MTKFPQALLLCSVVASGTAISLSAIAQPAPVGPHPRIWLDAPTRQALQQQLTAAESPVKRAQTRCTDARTNPSAYASGGWQGFEFVLTLSSCLVAYEAGGNADDLGTAVKYFRVLLDDYQSVGDGAGGDNVVTHDTGYAMRTFAPYSALAYDWLHDAPGVTEDLLSHARARFDAWSTYYTKQGYLRDLPGANYQAGYAFAATLMAIAEAGEAGAAGDAHWANVRDVIWQKDLLPAFQAGGVLDGGDWPEGWQYGSLSVLEHALAARALLDSGLQLPGAASWASALPLRFAHGLTPAARQSFVGGDSDSTTPYRKPDNGALLAALAGPASAEAKALARTLNRELALQNENALFDALAAAKGGPEATIPSDAPTSYLARGVGNFYARSDWSQSGSFAVFQCAPRLVDDHQYANAGNWVLTRGRDDVVVDPSPYGSLSTLTGNAPAVDSSALPSGYSPSQGFWGKRTSLVWTRQGGSGVAAARCDYADQFGREGTPSDVQSALRDFVLLPAAGGATVVLLDRVVTGAAERSLHFRVRSPADLSLASDEARGTLGSSGLSIRKLWASSGSPNVRAMPRGSECPSSDHACDVSKLDSGSEYRLDVSGPSAGALHVVTASATGTSPSTTLLQGPGFRGAGVQQGSQSFVVIASDGATASAPLTYRATAQAGSVHVVVDAPTDTAGASDVSATLRGAECEVTVAPHVGGSSAGFSGRPLIVRLDQACAITDDGSVANAPPAMPTEGTQSEGQGGSGSGTFTASSSATPGVAAMAGTSGSTASGAGEDSTGCAVVKGAGSRGVASSWLLGAAAALGVSRLRRRRGPHAR